MSFLATTSRIGKSLDSPSSSSKDSRSKPLPPNRFQFEPPESIAEETAGSIQRSASLDVRALKRSQSHNTIGSRQRFIDPQQFSTQNPWIPQSNKTASPRRSPALQSRRLPKSVSAASLATVKQFLKKGSQPLRSPIKSSDAYQVNFDEYSPNPLLQSFRQQNKDFSSSFTPTEIVIQPQRTNSQISIVLKPESPLSIGGGLIHGEVTVKVPVAKDAVQSHQLGIGYLSVDLVGVESCNKRHYVFQSLAVDLIDRKRPPPGQSTSSVAVSSEGYWGLAPSVFSIPFQLELPEDPGPPPYKSRHGSIRYLLSTTAFIRTEVEETLVRDTCEVFVLGPHNPRISLVNLPHPLNATDTFVLSRGLPFQDITLRASLNRDVWASGMSIFVDIHVRNRSLKWINKVTLSLERVMMVYHHPIAQLDRGLYRQSRLPDKIHRKTVASKTTSRSNVGWRGIGPLSRESRTWMLDLPNGLATINTGRFFGVRYFLKVSLHLPFMTGTLEAQLPVTILDPNSLDITSEFEPRRFTSSRPRPSTINSHLPPSSLLGPYGRKAEQKTPTQAQASRQRRETWAWVTEVSPHPSLVPSPLLPAYGVPSKTGKTPSRLRVENKLSTSHIPIVPERLRPPLEEQSADDLNRGHRFGSSDYPMTGTDMTSPSSQEVKHGRGIGTSTIASLRAQVQGARGNFGGKQDPAVPGTDRNDRSQALQNPYRMRLESDHPPDNQNHPSLKVVFEDNQTVARSPMRIRKPNNHRRIISRSKDVQAIYRPLSKENSRAQLAKETQNSQENGWETVENFF